MLKMTVAGDSRDRAIELARRMEESRRFSQTNIISERTRQASTNGDTEQFDIAAVYIPEPLAAAAPSRRQNPSRQVRIHRRPESENKTSNSIGRKP